MPTGGVSLDNVAEWIRPARWPWAGRQPDRQGQDRRLRQDYRDRPRQFVEKIRAARGQ